MQAVIDEAGQITIPKGVREELGLMPGQMVDVVVGGEGLVIIRKIETTPRGTPDRFERLRGSLNLGMSTDEFMALMRGDD